MHNTATQITKVHHGQQTILVVVHGWEITQLQVLVLVQMSASMYMVYQVITTQLLTLKAQAVLVLGVVIQLIAIRLLQMIALSMFAGLSTTISIQINWTLVTGCRHMIMVHHLIITSYMLELMIKPYQVLVSAQVRVQVHLSRPQHQ